MLFTLSNVVQSDAESLIRKCEFPAMLDNPLRALMFPHNQPDTQEEEIQWAIKGLEEAIDSPTMKFRKVSLQDGTPIGFAGWQCTTTSLGMKDNTTKHKNWVPKSLDLKTWFEVSISLRAEREKVLQNHTNVWRR
jgi:hypothetical protein